MALTPAQKQQAYRDRKHAVRTAMLAEVEREAARLLLQEFDLIAAKATVARLERLATLEIERAAAVAAEQAALEAAEARQKAEDAARQRGIEDGSLHPSGRPWALNEPIRRPGTPTSARAMMEAGRRAALDYAVAQFVKTGALVPDPDGPRRRVECPAGRIRYDWHRDY